MTVAELLGVPYLAEGFAAFAVIAVAAMLASLWLAARRNDATLKTALGEALDQIRDEGLSVSPPAPLSLEGYARLAEVPEPGALCGASVEEIHRAYEGLAERDPHLAGRLKNAAFLKRREHAESQGA